MAAAQFASATLESQTVDESYHLTAGYAFLTSRTLNTGTEHPPLAQAICALPLLFLHLPAPGPADVDYRSELKREAKLLYGNSVSADAILLAARSSQIVLTLFLGLLIAWWTRRHFGSAPALAALALFAFDPNFLAHGHYVTNDVPAALAFLAGCLSWNAYLAGGRRSRLVFCGVVLGLAVSAKYSTLLLFPAFAYLYGCRWWHQSHAAGLQPFRYSLRHLTRSMLAAALVMMVVVWAAFGFETAPLLPPGPLSGPGPAIWAGFQGPLGWAVRNLPLPAPSFLNGVLALFWHNNSAGHSAYLLGQHSQSGWWYYFPVLAAVKTPAGTLLLFLLAAGAAGMLLWRGGSLAARARLKRLRPEWYAIAVPALLYLAACLRGHINIGIRHLRPFYPFLFIWIAAVLFSSRRRPLPPEAP
ncbi:MAG: phospholipid carrier-dependent glycosyltransferase [Acidobacteriia bacterium]|nr:phospholipid carrier-dependent glycosyltransferase [Terriglobia bacterium]